METTVIDLLAHTHTPGGKGDLTDRPGSRLGGCAITNTGCGWLVHSGRTDRGRRDLCALAIGHSKETSDGVGKSSHIVEVSQSQNQTGCGGIRTFIGAGSGACVGGGGLTPVAVDRQLEHKDSSGGGKKDVGSSKRKW